MDTFNRFPMIIRKLLLAGCLIVVSFVLLFLVQRSGIIPISTPFLDKFEFDYVRGKPPWQPNIDTKINTTFDQIATRITGYGVCKGDETDPPQTSNGIEYICLQGFGSKMIFPHGQNYKTDVFISPQKGGVLELKHQIDPYGYPKLFYEKKYQGHPYPFFVIDYMDREIPTSDPQMARTALASWEKEVKSLNSIDNT